LIDGKRRLTKRSHQLGIHKPARWFHQAVKLIVKSKAQTNPAVGSRWPLVAREIKIIT